MHILSANQRKALDTFIAKIPESTVKGNYERWNEKIVSNNDMITSSDMDSFIALSHGLDTDLQSFPQIFSYNVKNYINFGETIPTTKVEKEVPKKAAAKKVVVKKAVVVAPKKVVAKKVVVPVKAVVKKKK